MMLHHKVAMDVRERKIRTAEQGFTLVELSVVVAIVALVATFGLDIVGTYMQRTAHNTTRDKLEVIEERLQEFREANGRYPCPADQTLGYTNTNYGVEACGTGNVVSVGSAYIGTLPIRALHLPMDYIGDSWEHKFTYAVTTALTTDIDSANGNLRVTGGHLDSASDYYDLTETPSTAAYVVLSHGQDGKGAYSLRGTALSKACIPATTTLHDDMIDVENCDHTISGSEDVWFFEAVYNDGDIEDRYFDDLILWKVK